MRMNISLLEDLERHAERLDIKTALGRIEVPVLIIHGSEDMAVDADEAQTIYDGLKSKDLSMLKILENTGHTFGAVHPFAGSTAHLETVIEEVVSFSQ